MNTHYTSLNPATEETIEIHNQLSDKELDTLLANSWTAYQEWRNVSLTTRLESIKKLKVGLSGSIEELAKCVSLEMGKLYSDAKLEASRLLDFCDYAINNSAQILAPAPIQTVGKSAIGIHEPLGVIFSITPWNAPIATPFRNILPAIVTGNSVILKPAPNVAGCAKILVRIFQECGLPKNLVTLALINNEQAEKLIGDSRIRKIAFTGSSAVGAHLGSIAGANIKPIVLELGGSDPCLILDSTNIQKISMDLAASRCGNAGQVCCSPKRFIVDKNIVSEFKEAFVTAMYSFIPGDPFSPTSKLGPMARNDLRVKLESQFEKLKSNGAKVLMNGGTALDKTGYYFNPAVLEEAKENALSYTEELFGPVGIIIPADDLNDAIQIANATKYGLGATVYSDDKDKIKTATAQLEAGFVHVNMPPRLHPDIPFGGSKASGFGRDCGEAGFLEYTNFKAVIS